MWRTEFMRGAIELDCPEEMLLGLHLSAEEFRDEVKPRAAVALFREGRMSSGVAARWLKVPRVRFLLLAMEKVGELLADPRADFQRERV
jgi:predicted HTH domain antitoxin